jgi:hypothetical protein
MCSEMSLSDGLYSSSKNLDLVSTWWPLNECCLASTTLLPCFCPTDYVGYRLRQSWNNCLCHIEVHKYGSPFFLYQPLSYMVSKSAHQAGSCIHVLERQMRIRWCMLPYIYLIWLLRSPQGHSSCKQSLSKMGVPLTRYIWIPVPV